ncbi:MAG TPA: hypothetical protein VGO22_07725 [Pseudorhizobium sp.]|nr:hypothetical protein [Pseudorhizobium sp.]
MRRHLIATFVACAIAGAAHPLRAQETGKSEPQGAVLCIWMISSSILRFGDTCRAEQDGEYLATLRRNVERMEAFIFRNSDITADQLEAYNRRRPSVQSAQCEPGSETMSLYENAKRQGNQLDEQTDKLLEVERPPVWNPCL